MKSILVSKDILNQITKHIESSVQIVTITEERMSDVKFRDNIYSFKDLLSEIPRLQGKIIDTNVDLISYICCNKLFYKEELIDHILEKHISNKKQ